MKNQYEILQEKILNIAEKYADLVEEQIEASMELDSEKDVDFDKINEGIRMLNHVAATLERMVRLQCADGPDRNYTTSH